MDQSSGRLAIGGDGDGLITPGVVRHVNAEAGSGATLVPIYVGEGDDMLGRSSIIVSTRTQTKVVVRDVTRILGGVHAGGAKRVGASIR